MIDHLEAESVTYTIFKEALDSLAPSILGYVPEVIWEGIETSSKPDTDKAYIETDFESILAEQKGFSFCSDTGKRLYKEEGLATFVIHTPFAWSQGNRLAKQLALEIRKAFRIRNDEVCYRKQRVYKMYPQNQFYRTVFSTEFYFTEVG